jgi:shikimate kinase
MGSGKSFVGRKLSKILDLPFIDLDQLLEQTYHLSVNDFFNRYGEDAFRQAERSILLSTEQLITGIISTGGGTPCYYDNMSWMKANGYTVYLRMNAKALCYRLKESKKPRPLIRDLGSNDLLPFIEAKLIEREVFYSQADLVYQGENLSVSAFAERLSGINDLVRF